MATITRNWAAQSQIIGTGDGYITLSGTTESYSSDVNLETNGYEGAVVSLEYDSAGTTDNIIISFFGSTDGGSTYDDTPFFSQEVDATSGTDEQISFIIKDYPHFRIGVKTSGTTDSFDYRIMYDAWNWQSA